MVSRSEMLSKESQDVSQPRWILSYFLKILCLFTAARDTYFHGKGVPLIHSKVGTSVGLSIDSSRCLTRQIKQSKTTETLHLE
jgi:hypothetical protein